MASRSSLGASRGLRRNSSPAPANQHQDKICFRHTPRGEHILYGYLLVDSRMVPQKTQSNSSALFSHFHVCMYHASKRA
ncbi:hypothetical protein I7I53_03980 [Histoplasma capsulatum var. duboisii H88]|uniref:Uncharacterized protein n=1 Tax=Ajellomyces capsulatus (strain H88) TaxID=544711 RepID=A0A8A1LPU7_AJEC8|nr:hypothetical protein I7I53_03980 [Histoplasma capsulatum var. duboisii H88]